MARRESPRRAFWLEHLAKARAQGGTLKAYADANELSLSALYAAKSAYENRTNARHTKTKGAATLLPVQLRPSGSSAMVRIALPTGLRIEVPSTFSVDEWRPLLTLLANAS